MVFNSKLCIKLEELQKILHLMFNSAQSHYFDEFILNNLLSYPHSPWPIFLEVEIINVISKYKSSLTLGSDHLL